MKKMRKRDARLLVLLSLLALLPLAIWACADAGDGPGAPTGPSTKYNPGMDQKGATLVATASRSTVGPGETFGISATFKDANGLPVEGAPIIVGAEAGIRQPAFSYQTNPTLTDANGMASIKVTVPADCPLDSYTFVVATHAGVGAATTRTFVHIVVGGTATAIVTGLTLTTSTATVEEDTAAVFLATATATPSCTVVFQYQATGAGVNIPWTNAPAGTRNPWQFSVTPPNAGTLSVLVSAFCNENGRGLVSDPVTVTVSAAAAP